MGTAPELEALSRRLSHHFHDVALLAGAVTHRSWCGESWGDESNERLEFLGDAVLGLVVTDHVFRTYTDLPEGELAKVRSSVVSASTLADVALELGLGEALRLGRGEDNSGGRSKPSILADALEAVIGAVYLDGGWSEASALVMRCLSARIADAASGPGALDYKTRLQELAARRFECLPRYEVAERGPDHAKHFVATVEVGGILSGKGEGSSKKQAEQEAARMIWRTLEAERGVASSEEVSV